MVGSGVLSVATPEVVSLEGSFEELSEQDEKDSTRFHTEEKIKKYEEEINKLKNAIQ